MHSKSFGKLLDGRQVTGYTIEHPQGHSMTVLDYGCTIQGIEIASPNGHITDVVLGYDTGAEYEVNNCFFGGTIGRYGNRIGGGHFTLNQKKYELACNDGANHLHGGNFGFHTQMWDVQTQGEKLVLSRLSPDGEEGYPGNLTISVTMELRDDGAVVITYNAISDADTILSLTNHSYFNLNGHGSALAQELKIYGDKLTENDAGALPTGKYLPVEGTPFDFSTFKAIGADIEEEHIQLKFGGGYDHNYALSDEKHLKLGAELKGLETGISMTVQTTEPGMQFYSGNFITPAMGKGGHGVNRRDGICLETQKFPNSMAHPHFPTPVLKAGVGYETQTIYQFKTV